MSKVRERHGVMEGEGLLPTKKYNIEEDVEEKEKSWWKGKDRNSVFLLIFLYLLQGLPLGIAGAIPMILAVSYIFNFFFNFIHSLFFKLNILLI